MKGSKNINSWNFKANVFSKVRFLVIVFLFFGFVLFFSGELQAVVDQTAPPPRVSHNMSEIIWDDGNSLQVLLQTISNRLDDLVKKYAVLERKHDDNYDYSLDRIQDYNIKSLERRVNCLETPGCVSGVCGSNIKECDAGNYRRGDRWVPSDDLDIYVPPYHWYCDGINGGRNVTCRYYSYPLEEYPFWDGEYDDIYYFPEEDLPEEGFPWDGRYDDPPIDNY